MIRRLTRLQNSEIAIRFHVTVSDYVKRSVLSRCVNNFRERIHYFPIFLIITNGFRIRLVIL